MAHPSLFRGMLARLAPTPLPTPVTGAIEKILRLDHLERFYEDAAIHRNGALHTATPWPEPTSIDDLDRLVRDIEPGARGTPVLLRHYLKLNGRLCAFNLAPAFGNCLDGLIVVDFDSSPGQHLARYLRRPDRVDRFTL